MLITTEFVFLHVPKTGGEFLKTLCERHFASRLVQHTVPKHAGVARIPEEYQQLPRFGLVRNPWDWYVSWYHYLSAGRNSVLYLEWNEVSADNTNDFATTVANICTGKVEQSNPELAARMRSRESGLLSMHCLDILGSDMSTNATVVGRTECLRGDFLDFLCDNRIDVPVTLEYELQRARPLNTSARGGYQKYYNAELKALVAHRERDIITKYGYRF